MLVVFALFCLASCPLTMGQFYNNYQTNSYQQFNNRQGYQRQMGFNRPGFYNGFNLRPEDQAAVNEVGTEGIEIGKKALNIATELAKGAFPESGPIVTEDGQIQTKWGNYQLPNPQDRDIVEKLLDATRDLLNKIPTV